MCTFHDDSRLLQRFSEVMEGGIVNENLVVNSGIIMDHSGSWMLKPGDSEIPELSESAALKLVAYGNPHVI